MKIASIWAQDRTGVLGTGDAMCWRVPADFAHFRSLTIGCPIIMGRASWESLGGALPQRMNIVITRSLGYAAEGAHVAHSVEEALAIAAEEARRAKADVVWITGGAQIYAETMDIADELVVTDLDLDVTDTLPPHTRLVRAPSIDEKVWRVDPTRSDMQWRPVSGDARWKVTTWVRYSPL